MNGDGPHDVWLTVFERVRSDQASTMDALAALGHLKEYVRDREARLVTRARQESRTWVDIADALRRDIGLMELLHGRRRHEP